MPLEVKTREDYIAEALVRIANNSTGILKEFRDIRRSLEKLASK